MGEDCSFANMFKQEMGHQEGKDSSELKERNCNRGFDSCSQ